MNNPETVRLPTEAGDGHRIVVETHVPAGPARGIVQVLHGLGEHTGRYARFAAAANERGLIVAMHNHRGHGAQAAVAGWFAHRNGWALLTADALRVHEHVAAEHGELPVTLLGHSMGSFIAQNFAMLHGGRLSALLLSGSTWHSRARLLPAHLLARAECARLGEKSCSPLLEKAGFASFNKAFSPPRTPFDWLSRDESEVDRYIADPLCGGPFTAGLWRDLTGGLLSIMSDHALSRIPGDLPILISGGEKDPVGGDAGMGRLALHYAQTGHQRLKVKIYPGARHELLNETQRDEVTRDWLDWIVASMRV